MFNEADGGGMSVFRQAKQIVEIMAGIQGPWTPLSLRTRRGRVVFVVKRRSHRVVPLSRSSRRRYRET